MAETVIDAMRDALAKADASREDERELKLLRMCLAYQADPFGAPNHALMLLVARLYNLLYIEPEKQEDFLDRFSELMGRNMPA